MGRTRAVPVVDGGYAFSKGESEPRSSSWFAVSAVLLPSKPPHCRRTPLVAVCMVGRRCALGVGRYVWSMGATRRCCAVCVVDRWCV